MYGRVWCVMRIPQIMGWWGIVLIQQTNAAETELPFWIKGRSLLFPESRPRSNGSWGRSVGLVVVSWGARDPTVLRVCGFCICKCMKIPVSENVRQIQTMWK